MNSILVVDDDDDSRELVCTYLARAGYDVRSAPNGRHALIAVAAALPDVIVLDVIMPEMNGLEFLQVIRSYVRWAAVPVVLLTAHGDGRHVDAAHGFGVHDTFLKASYQLSDLLACVNRLSARPGPPH